MKGSKIIIILLSMILAITIVAGGLFFAYMKFSASANGTEPSIDRVLESSVDIPEITSNLLNDDFIRISFKIQTDGKKAKKELEKREFQVQNIIIQELSELSADDLKGKEGKLNLEESLKNKTNELMQDGEIVKVYITSAILQ